MRKLSIVLGIIILLGLFILFVVPGLIGFYIQKQYPKALQQFSSSPNVQVKLLSYHRGWFTSTAKVQVKLNSEWDKWQTNAQTNTQSTITMDEQIHHGPFIVAKSAAGNRHFIFALALLHNKVDQANTAFASSTTWSFGGNLTTHVNAQKLILSNSKQQVALNGLSGNISYNLKSKHGKANLKLNQIHTQLQQQEHGKTVNVVAQLNNLKISADINKQGTLWYGMRNIHIGSFNTSVDNKTILNIKNLAVMLGQKKQNGTTNMMLNATIKSIDNNGVTTGPFKLALTIDKLNTKALEAFLQQASSLETQQQSIKDDITKLYQPLMNLLGKGLNIQLQQLFINTAEGTVNAKGQINLKAQQGGASIPGLIESLTINANAQFPPSWLSKQLESFYASRNVSQHSDQQISAKSLAEQQIQHWLSNSYLRKSGTNLTTSVSYANGRLMVNGKPISLLPHKTTTPQPQQQQQQQQQQHTTPDQPSTTVKKAVNS